MTSDLDWRCRTRRMARVWLAYGRRMYKMSMSAHRKPKRLPLPVRRSMNLTEAAYDRLRALNDRHGLGNNYLLVVLLERLDDYADPERLNQVFEDFIAEYGAPENRTAPDGRETDG